MILSSNSIRGISPFNLLKDSFSDKAGTIAKPLIFSISIAMSELFSSLKRTHSSGKENVNFQIGTFRG